MEVEVEGPGVGAGVGALELGLWCGEGGVSGGGGSKARAVGEAGIGAREVGERFGPRLVGEPEKVWEPGMVEVGLRQRVGVVKR